MELRRDPGAAVSLVLAGHPGLASVIAAGVAIAAVLSGRGPREVALVFATVLVGRFTAGWLNDVADRERDIAAERHDKPLARDWLDQSTVTFSVASATCLVIPLSISNGTLAGIAHLLAVAAAWAYNTRIKLTVLSWLPWALSFGLYPAFLSYGGWGGGIHGGPPNLLVTALAALVGVGVHVTTALPDLVGDNRNGVRSLPVRMALRIGAAKLLLVSWIYLGTVLAGLSVAALTVGFHQ